MKKYSNLGELLIDFRNLNGLSQLDMASKLEVDVRTILRWEQNETLLKSNKEEQMAEITFIPHQVIRNVNTSFVIPTYYDFELRKYSLSSLSNPLPEISWIKESIDIVSNKIRPIETEKDINNIIRYTLAQKNSLKTISKLVIREAIRLLPELNLLVVDEQGNYAGHSLYFPLSIEAYQKIKNQELMENDITIDHLVNYKDQSPPVFYCHSITADCNENFFFIIAAVLKFYRDTPLDKNYIYAIITSRYDSYDMNKDLGVQLIWEDVIQQEKLNLKAPPRLYEGNFTAFLNKENC
ncbi:MAG: helix-turn-helix domain-containing protein [Flavobacteriaceae bacterium]|nr:helix-turn-helix domain-containing protein [Flavobacteriaceae bacterium]